MNKLLLIVVLTISMCPGIANAEIVPNPKGDGPFEKDRLVVQIISGYYVSYVLTDLKTGCQYITNGPQFTSLGCFPEYISDKFKK